ncbi:hypothetical protein TSOC_005800 [Tetrabaena socialis]|uniref:Uncharacterized protein n=1 Tax=Tetrabaena socialis TaxID=47790 RepID=A0A2J8A5B7_9CHLO|nr:hypothetical protein TSOC_005800 [Tetrabaena socialis]|eukprot:PNH07716.1 hypothetical protein TSOC_005800 [Tetrabaena socialis]
MPVLVGRWRRGCGGGAPYRSAVAGAAPSPLRPPPSPSPLRCLALPGDGGAPARPAAELAPAPGRLHACEEPPDAGAAAVLAGRDRAGWGGGSGSAEAVVGAGHSFAGRQPREGARDTAIGRQAVAKSSLAAAGVVRVIQPPFAAGVAGGLAAVEGKAAVLAVAAEAVGPKSYAFE